MNDVFEDRPAPGRSSRNYVTRRHAESESHSGSPNKLADLPDEKSNVVETLKARVISMRQGVTPSMAATLSDQFGVPGYDPVDKLADMAALPHSGMPLNGREEIIQGARNPTHIRILPSHKQKVIQQQLIYLIHSYRCQIGGNNPCPLPFCSMIKMALKHMANCRDGNRCLHRLCSSSRQILNHYKHCTAEDCPVCAPVKALVKAQVAARVAASRSVKNVVVDDYKTGLPVATDECNNSSSASSSTTSSNFAVCHGVNVTTYSGKYAEDARRTK